MFTNRIAATIARIGLGAAILSAAVAGTASANGLNFRLHNDTNATVVGVYFAPAGSRDWKSVSGDTISPGETSDINFSGSYSTCYYDLVAVLDDGRKAVDADVNLCRTEDIFV